MSEETFQSNSWVIVEKETGQCVAEIHSEHVLQIVNREKFDILTTYQYLANFNRRDKNGQVVS